ncbi:MAG: 2-dehydropantoate 2-reductase [SAR202 cluster bacterium]|jgi:2-dehydropantoate 2-reductase|nr:2-dehydropantoate 2-reductase [Dehalococcoidia bacterium]MQG54979.1 2-dehydropantoate 2-reductase [SAR202 cluster bacterium]|tara:strand:- start:46 stop:999 length:954 start_codon:yes stop_codon:yes gene_type:complete
MEIVVLGAGALGSIISGHLARAGESVSLIARGDRARFLQQNGVTVTGLSKFNASCPVITDANALSGGDVLILAVKSHDVDAALASVADMKFSSVLSVQNGVYGNEQLARVFGSQATLGATASFSGEVSPQGEVRFTVNGGFFIGELPSGLSPRVKDLATTLANSGINAEAVPNIQSLQWSKFVLWVAYTSISVLTRLPTYKFLSDQDTALLCARIMREVANVAKHREIALEDVGFPVISVVNDTEDAAVSVLNKFSNDLEENSPYHRMSTLQDLENGKRLEIDATLGYAVDAAQMCGLPAPTLDVCYTLIKGINRLL